MSRIRGIRIPRTLIIAVVAISGFGTVANTVLIGVALNKNSKLAQDGADARATQCRTFSARLESYESQFERGMISAKSYATLIVPPRDCPKPQRR